MKIKSTTNKLMKISGKLELSLLMYYLKFEDTAKKKKKKTLRQP